MAYNYSGKQIKEAPRHYPATEHEARAKFAYFREAESKINGGPAPIQKTSECGTNGGYMRHFRLKEERCAPCKAAHTQVELKRQRAQSAHSINLNAASHKNKMRDTPLLNQELRKPEIELVVQAEIKNGPGSATNTVLRGLTTN